MPRPAEPALRAVEPTFFDSTLGTPLTLVAEGLIPPATLDFDQPAKSTRPPAVVSAFIDDGEVERRFHHRRLVLDVRLRPRRKVVVGADVGSLFRGLALGDAFRHHRLGLAPLALRDDARVGGSAEGHSIARVRGAAVGDSSQRAPRFLSVLVALLGLAREQVHHPRVEIVVDARLPLLGPNRIVRHLLREHLDRRGRFVREVVGEHLVGDAAHRVEIGGGRDFGAEHLLRRHERGRAQERAGVGGLDRAARAIGLLGQAEVDHLKYSPRRVASARGRIRAWHDRAPYRLPDPGECSAVSCVVRYKDV